MNKAKLRWILTLMGCIIAISAFSAEVVNYCTSLKDNDANRIEMCKKNIETAVANLTTIEELKNANAILTNSLTDLLKDRAALSGSSGNTAQTSNKKSIEKEKYTTLTSETLSQLGYSTTDCNGLGAYYYSKGHNDRLKDDSTAKLAYAINMALLEAQQSKVRLHNYLAGFNEAKPALSTESEDVGE